MLVAEDVFCEVKRTLKKGSFLLAMFVFSSQLIAQDFDFTPVTSKGEVPEAFLQSALDAYLEDLDKQSSVIEDQKKQEAAELFLQSSNLGFNQLLWSGKTIYGDIFSDYVNKVGANVLTVFPELKDQIKFYTFKSSSLNAFVTGKGAIFVNVGLLAHLDNEAQLAFVLCHELIHYKNKHSFNKFSERYDLFNKRNKDDLLNYDSKIDLLFKFNKNNESEADSLGIEAYNKLGYSSYAVIDALSKLYYSYMPIENVIFDYTFLGFPDFEIPDDLKLASVKEISEIKPVSDLFVTHPNIFSRINNAKKNLKSNIAKTSIFKVSNEKNFREISKNARFELVNQLLVGREYAKAIYTIYALQKVYGDSRYLELSLIKAFYGVSKYKTKERLQDVMKGYFNIEGESQKIAFFLKKISRSQLNAVSIKLCYNYLEKNPNSPSVNNYYESLIKDFVLELDQDISKYNQKHLEYDKELYAKKYHFNSFVSFINDKKFQELIEKYQKEKVINKAKELEQELFTLKQIERQDKREELEERKNGFKETVNKIIILDPTCVVKSKKGKHEFIESIREKDKLDNMIIVNSEKFNLNISLLSSSMVGERFDVENFILLNEWYEERSTHSKVEMFPLQSDYVNNVIEKYGTKYIYKVYIYLNRLRNQTFIVSELINLETGKKLINNTKYKKGTFSEVYINTIIERDFKRISKSK